jgi:hypothetical protein
MPPRFFVWVILLFWLATAGWLFQRAFLPRLLPDHRPRFFRFQHADEVRRSSVPWLVQRDKQKIGSPIDIFDEKLKVASGSTELRRQKHGFEVTCELNCTNFVILDLRKVGLLRLPFKEVDINKILSTFRVSVRGELRFLKTEVTIGFDGTNLPITALVKGKVQNGHFASTLRVTGLSGFRPITLEPVEVAPDQCFLNPMHPLDRIWDLEEGQHWRMPLSDPLADAVRGMLAKWPVLSDMLSRKPTYLDADVISRTLRLGHKDVACWTIDFREPGKPKVVARTWVRKSDNRVLRQEAAFESGRLVMTRRWVGG